MAPPPTATATAERYALDASLRRLGIAPPSCRRVLLVDDEPLNLTVLGGLLEDDDLDVHTAESAALALALVEREGPMDLVITDQRMPGRTGVELLSEMAERWPDTMRMVLTGYSDVEPIARSVNDGAVYRFLLKPFEGVEMRAAVRDALALKRDMTALRLVISELIDRKSRNLRALAEKRRLDEQLAQQERLATLGRLTSGISHELRNHVQIMLGVADAIRALSQDEELLTGTERALVAVQSLYQLLCDVNALARSRPITLEPLLFDVERFIKEAIGLMRLDPAWNHPQVVIQVAPDARLVRGDPSRLRQAFMAIVRNALLAMDSRSVTGEPRVEIAVRRFGRSQIALEVRDVGAGMTADVLAQAQTPFFSAFEPPGLGLGLPVALLVVQAHNGRIEIDSAAGQGTAVRIVIDGQNLPEGGMR